MKLVSLCK